MTVFYGVVDAGRLKLDNPNAYLVHISSLNGKKVELVLRKRKSKRSLNQNAYYWSVVVEILGKYFGYEPEEMHEALKFQFLRITNDKGLVSVMSTSKLSTDKFSQYVNRVVRWAAQEYGVYIPDPNEAAWQGIM